MLAKLSALPTASPAERKPGRLATISHRVFLLAVGERYLRTRGDESAPILPLCDPRIEDLGFAISSRMSYLLAKRNG
jgi:hypothetical protein